MNRSADSHVREFPDCRPASRERGCPRSERTFMESPLSFFRMHWDHEPPLTRPPATLSPSDGEREGVRGRFMERRDPAEDHGPNARQKFGEFSSPTFVPRYSICHSRLRQKLSLRYQTDNALRALATNREREPL